MSSVGIRVGCFLAMLCVACVGSPIRASWLQQATVVPGFTPIDEESALLVGDQIEVTFGSKTLKLNAALDELLALYTAAAAKSATAKHFFFSSTSQEIAASIGISGVSASFDQKNRFLFANYYTYLAIPVRAKVGGVEHGALVYFGVGCRLQFVGKSQDIDVAIGLGGNGNVSAGFHKSLESGAFKALGFDSFHSFELKPDATGSVDLIEARKAIVETFNAYVADAPGTTHKPCLLGMVLDKDLLAEIAKLKPK